MRKSVFYAFALCLLFIVITPVFADSAVDEKSGHFLRYEDDAQLIAAHEKEAVLASMTPLMKHCDVGFWTTRESGSTDLLAAAKLHEWFGSGTVNAVLFLIDMNTREIYIFSDGEAYECLGSEWAYIITDNIYKKAGRGEYADCATDAFRQIGIRLDGGRVPAPLRYATYAMLSLLCGTLLNYLFTNASRKRRTQPADDAAMLGSSFLFSFNNVRKRHTTTTRTRIESSGGGGGSSGGGSSGGGGGGGGGGGFSGGGGGHGF